MTTRFLGDTHLGKKFQNGVPLARRGDREQLQWAQFVAHLNDVEPGDLHIQTGDLFDAFQVSYDVTYHTARAYIRAAQNNPMVQYVVLRGNHDCSRDLERVSSFDVFEGLVDTCTNIKVVVDKPYYHGGFVFLPWHPEISAADMAASITPGGFDKATGHWDIVAIGDTHNLIPIEALKVAGVKHVYTGHDHLAREIVVDAMPVTVVGSMQPYSHAEDPDEQIYVTRTLKQVLAGPDLFRDNCLRVVLGQDEVFDLTLDCLQLQVVREKAEAEELGQVEFETFDLVELFNLAATEIGLGADMAKLALEKLEDARL